MSETVKYNLDDMTLEDAEIIEEYIGRSIDELFIEVPGKFVTDEDGNEQPQRTLDAKGITVVAFLASRLSNPDLTIEEFRKNTKISSLKSVVVADPPTEATGSAE